MKKVIKTKISLFPITSNKGENKWNSIITSKEQRFGLTS